jgi:DNA-binding NtrC family response regulator
LRGRRTAGSAAHGDIVIADRSVSRLHLELEPTGEGLWVRDLGSRNGTLVNGMRIGEARVASGATIRVGTTEMTVTYGDRATDPGVGHDGPDSFGGLVTAAPRMRAVFAALERLAPTDAPLILQGERGTGKKRLAQAVHDASHRAGGPFVVVECAALPDESHESEIARMMEEALVGAEGGTLVLDAPEDLPLSVQRELTPPLEAKAFRLITTTQRDLRRLVNEGTFREGLYFQLASAGGTVTVPPLRERREDLEGLFRFFLTAPATASGSFSTAGAKSGEEADFVVTAELLSDLEQLPWPGNLPELRRHAERLRALAATDAVPSFASLGTLRRDDEGTVEMPTFQALAEQEQDSRGLPVVQDLGQLLPPALEPWFGIGFKEYRERWIELGEREYLRRLMARTNRSSSAASREAGLERTYLYRLIKKHGV